MKYTINLTCNQEEHFSFNLVTHRLKAKEEGRVERVEREKE